MAFKQGTVFMYRKAPTVIENDDHATGWSVILAVLLGGTVAGYILFAAIADTGLRPVATESFAHSPLPHVVE